MHGGFCFITARKSLHCSSCKRYTWTSWTECWKDGNVSDMKERSPTLTRFPSYLLPLWPVTCNIIFTEHGMHYFPSFQQKIKSWVSSLSDMSSKYQEEWLLLHRLPVFFSIIKKKCDSKIWIITLVTTIPCVYHIITGGLSFIVGSRINLTVQPYPRSTNLQFPLFILLSTTALDPICHSSFPVICCITVCLKCLLTNDLFPPPLGKFCFIHPVKGVKFLRQKVCFTQIDR